MPAAARTARKLFLVGARVLGTDLVGADPGLLDQVAVAERQGALATRGRRDRSRADRESHSDAHAAAAGPTAHPDPDRRSAAIGRPAFGYPGVHLGTVRELAAARRRSPRAQ